MLDELDVSQFARLIRDRSGLALDGPRLRDLERAIDKTLEATGLSDPRTLYRLIDDPRGGRDALRTLVSAITIGETHFFRHRPQMDALEGRILPDIIARHRDDRRLRVWSAGCSTGEETYSLAILLRRALPDIADWDVTLVGTDIDVNALEKARRGVYRSWSFREVPADVESHYFTRVGSGREILSTIRDMVTFEYLNLAEDVYPSLLNKTVGVDLVVCRNVLIYLDRSTITRVAEGFHGSLADGGWLLVGPAEASQDTFRRFEVHNLPGTTVYQKPGACDRAPDRSPAPWSVAPVPEAAPAVEGPRYPAGALRSEDPAFVNGKDETDPVGAETACSVAREHANRLELESALRWVEIAIDRAPLSAAAHHLHALILQERGRSDLALEALRRCVYADPDFVMGHFTLASLLETLGRRGRAVRSLEIAAGFLDGRDETAAVEGGDGLTVGRLRSLVEERRRLWT